MLDFLNQQSGALTVLFTAVVSLSTVVYAILTALLVAETRRMRQAQTEPKIEVMLKPREEWLNLVHLHVRNIGLGPAYELSLDLRPEAGGDGAQKLVDDFTKANFFKTGLKYLGPAQEVLSHYSQMTELFDQKITAVLACEVRYKGATGKRYQENFRIDFSELKGLTQIGRPPLYAMAQTLERIERDLYNALTGFNRIKTDIYTEVDQQREKKEWEEYREQAIAQDKKATDA